jgi:hypothetical protein
MSRVANIVKNLAVYRGFKRSTCLKFRLLGCSNLDGLTCAGVSASAGGAVCDGERTETNDANFIT